MSKAKNFQYGDILFFNDGVHQPMVGYYDDDDMEGRLPMVYLICLRGEFCLPRRHCRLATEDEIREYEKKMKKKWGDVAPVTNAMIGAKPGPEEFFQ